MLVSKKHGTLENTRLLQVTSLNNDGATQMYGYKCSFNTIQDGHFRGCSQMGGEGSKKAHLRKICHTYHTMMKLCTVIPYLKKIKKQYESRDTVLEFS